MVGHEDLADELHKAAPRLRAHADAIELGDERQATLLAQAGTTPNGLRKLADDAEQAAGVLRGGPTEQGA